MILSLIAFFSFFRHREIRRQMSHSHAIQGLTLKPDMLVDDHDIIDREVIEDMSFISILLLLLLLCSETRGRETELHCQSSRAFHTHRMCKFIVDRAMMCQ